MCVEPTRSANNITKFVLEFVWERRNVSELSILEEKYLLLFGSFKIFETLALLSVMAFNILAPLVPANCSSEINLAMSSWIE
ncbi:MAG: hypothetical protein WBV72_10540 [Nitrososphaeraceae archaeon]